MANLLNYQFSRLGDFFCKTNTLAAANFKSSFNSLHLVRVQNQFQFRFITDFELKKELMSLNNQKPIGPSSIPPWALNDGSIIPGRFDDCDIIVGHFYKCH